MLAGAAQAVLAWLRLAPLLPKSSVAAVVAVAVGIAIAIAVVVSIAWLLLCAVPH
ncbi:hypothetical protein GLA29479_2898 [Lysobacter antibioticus]|nr:hypothetical protein GLA29479_2898 [Lysobacter antibioticus]